jgi:hypothetical protein
MAEVADKCIVDAVNASDQYSKWASAERAKNIRASIAEIERLELDWCNGVICFANRPSAGTGASAGRLRRDRDAKARCPAASC